MLSHPFFVRFVFVTLLLSWTSNTSILPHSHRRSSLHEKLLDPKRRPGLLRREDYDFPHYEALQAPRSDPGSTKPVLSGAKKPVVLEVARIDVFGFPFYFTNVAFGSPPQPFALLIDLQYGGAVVRSVDCHNRIPNDCGERVLKYNHSASSTSQDLGLRFSLGLAGHTAQGSLFSDTMHILSLELQNATVGATDVFYGENILLSMLAEYCDG